MTTESNHQRDKGAAEAHARADQLDDINRANSRQAGSPERPQEAQDTEGQQDEEDPEELSAIIHDLALL